MMEEYANKLASELNYRKMELVRNRLKEVAGEDFDPEEDAKKVFPQVKVRIIENGREEWWFNPKDCDTDEPTLLIMFYPTVVAPLTTGTQAVEVRASQTYYKPQQ